MRKRERKEKRARERERERERERRERDLERERRSNISKISQKSNFIPFNLVAIPGKFSKIRKLASRSKIRNYNRKDEVESQKLGRKNHAFSI